MKNEKRYAKRHTACETSVYWALRRRTASRCQPSTRSERIRNAQPRESSNPNQIRVYIAKITFTTLIDHFTSLCLGARFIVTNL